MAYVVPGSLLRFKDEQLEGQWVEWFHTGARAHDMAWTLMNVCLNLASGYKLLANRSPALLLWAAACHLVLDGIMVFMQLRHPTVFVRRRDFFVAALRLVRLGEVAAAALPADLPWAYLVGSIVVARCVQACLPLCCMMAPWRSRTYRSRRWSPWVAGGGCTPHGRCATR